MTQVMPPFLLSSATRLLREPLGLSGCLGGRWRCIHRPGRHVSLLLVRAHDGVLRIGDAPLELADSLPGRCAHLRQPLGSEQQQHDYENEKYFAETEVSEHGASLEERARDDVRQQD